MDKGDNKKAKHKDLKAATHILKKYALKRYREKLMQQHDEQETDENDANVQNESSKTASDHRKSNNTTMKMKIVSLPASSASYSESFLDSCSLIEMESEEKVEDSSGEVTNQDGVDIGETDGVPADNGGKETESAEAKEGDEVENTAQPAEKNVTEKVEGSAEEDLKENDTQENGNTEAPPEDKNEVDTEHVPDVNAAEEVPSDSSNTETTVGAEEKVMEIADKPDIATEDSKPEDEVKDADAVSQNEGAPPQQDEVAQQQDEVTPHQYEVAPQQDEVAPQQDEVAPQQGEVTQQQDEVAPQQDEIAQQQDEVAQQQDEVAPQQDEVAQQQDEVAPQQDEVAPAQEDKGDADTSESTDQEKPVEAGSEETPAQDAEKTVGETNDEVVDQDASKSAIQENGAETTQDGEKPSGTDNTEASPTDGEEGVIQGPDGPLKIDERLLTEPGILQERDVTDLYTADDDSAEPDAATDGKGEKAADEPETLPEEKVEEKVDSELVKKNVYYNLEEYQSIARVSENSDLPLDLLRFFHSFGYDCCKRANLHLLQGPTALFAAGNVVHLLNLTTSEHRFLRTCGGGGIGAITVHPSGDYFAVAEKGVKPHLLIYEFPSLKLFRILTGGTEKAYSFIDFNPKGDLLASVGSYPDYMLTVWDWTNEKVMLRSKAFSQEIYRVTFSPEQEGQLTSCGTTHIRFWKMAWTFTGLKLKGELGRFGKTSLSDIEGYIQLPDGKVLSGSDWGNMLLWDGGLIKVEICRKNQKPCHIGSIQQLSLDEGELITIGLDGYVRVWEMEAIDSADVTDTSDVFEIEPMNELRVGNGVKLTCMVKSNVESDADEAASIWFAQDANGGIWKLDLSFSHTTKPPEKIFAFTAGPATGVSCSPNSHLVATTGDAFIRIYDYLSKKEICHYHAPTQHANATCLMWASQVVDPKGTLLLAGFSDGILRLLTLQSLDEGVEELVLRQAMKPHSGSITSIAFNNTGEFLATGSTDQTVFFFSVTKGDYEPIGFVKVPGQVTCLEWSPVGFPDDTLLVSCSNGKVIEISHPSRSTSDTSHSYMLQNIPMKFFTFQSIKSRLRRDEERERREIKRQERRKDREKELKKRRERGEEISDEEAQAFLDEDPEAADEPEEEPLFFPSEPCSILRAFYLTPGRFAVSMDGFDAGYLYECTFPKDGSEHKDDVPSEPVRAIPVKDSQDVPITCFNFSHDRRKVISGFKNGTIRVYPLEPDPDVTFDLDMLSHHWDMNMHDNDSGLVLGISESYDGSYIFSGGGDGNMFGYYALSHEDLVKSMEGKRAKLPSPKAPTTEDMVVDDIDDPNAYSIEDAKLKAEHDKMIRDAEGKKMAERKRIGRLRKSFLELLQRNQELPEEVRLKRHEFELDPSLRLKMEAETEERIKQVKLEMQWDKAKLELAREKLENRFRAHIECDRIVVHALNSNHMVASYRVSKLTHDYHDLCKTVANKVRAASLASDTGTGGVLDGQGTTLGSDRGLSDSEKADDTSFLNEQKHKTNVTILQGRQAEKVAKALQKAEETRQKKEKRHQEWQELFKSKPDENYEDPADVAAIREAQANMGDFKLKTSKDYVVPEHLRMDTERKRYQALLLQGLIHKEKSAFNKKLIALRDNKEEMIGEIKSYVEEVKKLQQSMAKEDRVSVPSVPRMRKDEEPHRKFHFTKESLKKFEEDEKQRELDEEKKKRTGGGGLFGGFGDEEEEAEKDARSSVRSSRRGTSSVSSSVLSKSAAQAKRREDEVVPPTPLEIQLSQIEKIRVLYQRDRLLRLIAEKITAFDAELRLLRHHKIKLDVNLKMADLRQVTLLEELLLLKEYEKRETTLSGRVLSKKNELAEINNKTVEMQAKLESKRRDIDRLTDREKALYASFQSSLGDNNKFTDFLNKVFKKKIKRAKKKVVAEGEEEDSDASSSDESDWSSDEDEDDSTEGFDDTVCPPGCDPDLFDSVIALREKRLDLEEALVEERKLAETLKKDVDSFAKKSKVMESQLKTALADLEAFQVEKQGKLNELDVIVPLRLHQIEHVHNATVPSDLSQCLIFANSSLTALQRRIKELQHEKSEQRKYYKEARQQHVHLIKNRRLMEERIQVLEDKCEHMMMLKFGRVVDLEKLDAVTINKNAEELKEKLRRNEEKHAKELAKRQKRVERLKSKITELTRENTRRLETLNVLVNDKGNLEEDLDYRQKNMELEDHSKKKAEAREQHRLVQLVQLQAQEVQALKEEIGLLSRKGGHILPPAQPPIGQDPDTI